MDIEKSKRVYADELDKQDELAGFRSRFYIPDDGLIYMDGNSLGRMPSGAAKRIDQVAREEWGERLVRSWGMGWLDAPQRIGEKVARLVGAGPGQVIIGDSTSLNLFKLSMAALELRPDRSKIVSDAPNFPSDLYILQSCQRLLGNRHRIELLPEGDGTSMDMSAVLHAIDEQTALVLLSHVHFKSGFLYNARLVTERCHEAGALVLWDLSHSVGAVPIELDEWNVDFATGCTYKYLNGGPGAPAFLYANRSHQKEALSPVWGWFGQQAPFAFEKEYIPVEGVRRFLTGTPAILSLLTTEPGIDLALEAGIEPLRKKSIDLTTYFIDLFNERLSSLGFTLGTPRDPSMRGSHVSLRHVEGYRINRALIEEMKVIPDFREPDHIRFGLAPIYTSFREVWEAVDRTARVVAQKRFLNYPQARAAVT